MPQCGELRRLMVVQDIPVGGDDRRHRVDHKYGHDSFRHLIDRVHDRRQELPGHGYDAQDVLQIAEVHGQGGCDKGDADRQQVFYQDDRNQVPEDSDLNALAGDQQRRKYDDERQQHIDQLAGHMGDGEDFPREVDLLDHLLLCPDAAGAAGQGGTEKDPRNQRHEEEKVVILDAGAHDGGKYHGVDQQLQQRVQECPGKPQHRALVAPAQIPLDQAGDHGPIMIDFCDLFHKYVILLLLSPAGLTPAVRLRRKTFCMCPR